MDKKQEFLSAREKAFHTKLGRIINSHVKEEYPFTTKFFMLNETFYQAIEEIIDEAHVIYQKKIHEGLNKIEATSYCADMAYQVAKEKFLQIENEYKNQENPFDLDTSNFIDSTQLN